MESTSNQKLVANSNIASRPPTCALDKWVESSQGRCHEFEIGANVLEGRGGGHDPSPQLLWWN